MKAIYIISIFIIWDCNLSFSQKAKEEIIHKPIFSSLFVADSSSNSIYSLIGQPCQESINKLQLGKVLKKWNKQHHKVNFQVVSSIYPIAIRNRKCKLIYCLVYDKKDTLNCLLVRSGVIKSDCLNWTSNVDKLNTHTKIEELNSVTHNITETQFTELKLKFTAAENFAKTNKIGIWSEVRTSEHDND